MIGQQLGESLDVALRLFFQPDGQLRVFLGAAHARDVVVDYVTDQNVLNSKHLVVLDRAACLFLSHFDKVALY